LENAVTSRTGVSIVAHEPNEIFHVWSPFKTFFLEIGRYFNLDFKQN
jgi:hypothetical protein